MSASFPVLLDQLFACLSACTRRLYRCKETLGGSGFQTALGHKYRGRELLIEEQGGLLRLILDTGRHHSTTGLFKPFVLLGNTRAFIDNESVSLIANEEVNYAVPIGRIRTNKCYSNVMLIMQVKLREVCK